MIVALCLLTIICVAALLTLSLSVALWTYLFGVAQLAIVATALSNPALVRARDASCIYACVLAGVSLVCYSQSITIGSAFEPYLAGSDGQGYFAEAVLLARGNIIERIGEIRSNYLGYQVVLATAFQLLEQDLAIGLLINNTAVVASVVLVARTTSAVTNSPASAAFAALAFMLTTRHIFYSNVLLKEPFLTLGVALLVHAVVTLKMRMGLPVIAYASMLVATMIFGTMRAPMLVLVPLALLLLGQQLLRRGAIVIVGLLLSAGTLATVFASFTMQDFSGQGVQSTAVDNEVLAMAFASGVDAGGIVGRLMSGYTQLPLPVRFVTIPAPAIIQFVLPFDFWSTAFLDDHVANIFNNNLNVIWYLFVGVFVLFSVLNWRHLPDWTLKTLLVIGMAMFLMVAFIFGGVVPRYATPYLPFLYPVIGYWMSVLIHPGSLTSRLRRFFGLYYFCFGLAGAAYAIFQFTRA